MNENVAYRKILRCTNEVLVVALGRYLDKAKCKWFNVGKYM